MELQLGLALPTNTIPSRGFDLNSYDYKDDVSLPRSDAVTDTIRKKRGFSQSFHLSNPTFHATLPLLLWNNQPNDDDEDNDDSKDLDHSFGNDEEENGLVGWPPIRTRRKRINMQKRGGRAVADNRRPASENGRALNSHSQYVKVKMEGVGIARKVDLSLHNSIAALRATLMDMFDEKDSNRYTLTYQDMEGDWLLAEDVAWRNFIRSVQRIKLEKNDG